MKQVSIADLKARLSEYIAFAKSGEEVVITDRGRPVARIAPLKGGVARDAHLDQLVRSGAVRVPERRLPRDFSRSGLVPDRTGALLDALLEERAEGP
jgi:prevent-host-death family protein